MFNKKYRAKHNKLKWENIKKSEFKSDLPSKKLNFKITGCNLKL